jgi:hypothetical protein
LDLVAKLERLETKANQIQIMVAENSTTLAGFGSIVGKV